MDKKSMSVSTKNTTPTEELELTVNGNINVDLKVKVKTLPASSKKAATKSQPNQKKLIKSGPVATTSRVATTSAVTAAQQDRKLGPGYAYIFNNELFDETDNAFHNCSAKDVQVLVLAFRKLKIGFTIKRNATRNEINDTVREIASKDFTNHSCLIIVILSHGFQREVVAASDGNYSIDDMILSPILRNQTLTNKPKIFIVQTSNNEKVTMIGNPPEILKFYSTFEDFVPDRNLMGSPFIKTLCESLRRNYKTLDVLRIMESVQRLMKSNAKAGNGIFQPSSITSTLTKRYKFSDHIGP